MYGSLLTGREASGVLGRDAGELGLRQGEPEAAQEPVPPSGPSTLYCLSQYISGPSTCSCL